jgi:hypothetical protein
MRIFWASTVVKLKYKKTDVRNDGSSLFAFAISEKKKSVTCWALGQLARLSSKIQRGTCEKKAHVAPWLRPSSLSTVLRGHSVCVNFEFLTLEKRGALPAQINQFWNRIGQNEERTAHVSHRLLRAKHTSQANPPPDSIPAQRSISH